MEELQKEALIVRRAVTLPAKRLDTPVYTLDFTTGNLLSGMGNDPFEVVVQHAPKPMELRVVSSFRDYDHIETGSLM